MQAIHEKDQSLAQKMLLPLAEKKTKKYVDEGKIEAEAEVELYLMILEKQNKHSEMLELLASPVANTHLKNHLNFLTKRKADIYEAMNRLEDAYDTYKGLIDFHPDQFEYFDKMFSIALRLDNDRGNEDECVLKQLLNFTAKCTERTYKKGSKSKLRAPYLARIYFYYSLLQDECAHPFKQHLSSTITSNVADLLANYFNTFGNKVACSGDFKFILDKFPSCVNDLPKVLQIVTQSHNFAQLPSNVDEMYFYYNYCALQEMCGDLTGEERKALVLKLLKTYEHCLQFGENLLSSEIQPADFYFILISTLIAEEIQFDSSQAVVLISLLEQVLKKSPSDHYCKIVLVNLYNYVGAAGRAIKVYASLDVKHIQQDGLGYLICAPLYLSGQFLLTSYLFNNALRFYTSNLKDVSDSLADYNLLTACLQTYDYLISCYKYGSFSKVEEIMQLSDRLSNSLQFNTMSCEKMIVDVMIEATR